MPWTEPRTWVPGEVPGATEFNTHVRDNLRAVLPVGTLIYRAAVATAVETVVENRFLECNGVAVSRTTYAALFSYLNGLTPALPYGVGDGSTTFNLPDLRARVPVGAGGSRPEVDTLGENDGRAVTLRNISHTHAFSGINGVSGPAGGFGGNGSSFSTTGDSNNPNYPAYQVAGVWYIKYIS